MTVHALKYVSIQDLWVNVQVILFLYNQVKPITVHALKYVSIQDLWVNIQVICTGVQVDCKIVTVE